MSDRILIVEGEEGLRSRYKSELAALGYNVVTAQNGKRAVQRVRSEPIDLVVLELVLPDCSGFKCLEKLLTVRRDLKVVIHTAYAEYKRDFHSWAADAFLTKSSDLTELKDTIHSVLHPTPPRSSMPTPATRAASAPN